MGSNSGFEYACGWNKFTFNILGIWPTTKITPLGKYRALLNAIAIGIVITIPRLIGLFLYRNETDAMIQCLGTYVPFIIGIVKLITLHYRREVLAKFLEVMETDWAMPLSREQFEVMMRIAKIGRIISIFSGSIAYAANSIGIIVQKLYNVESLYIEHPDPRLTTNLFWIVYLPYDTTKTLNYVVSIVLQLYTSVFTAMFYFISDSFVVMLVLHLCGQLARIQISLRNLSDTADMRKFQNFHANLKSIVQEHEQLIRLAEGLKESFRFILILQLIGCTLMFCFQGYGMIRLLSHGSLNILQLVFSGTLVSATTVHFFFCCWAGEFLISQSTSVGHAAYECKWYELPHEEARLLIMIGLKKFRPLTLTAGNFSILSHNLFLKVVKCSMSYLSMLLAVQGRTL